MSDEEKKSTRGGRREGAGRKAGGTNPNAGRKPDGEPKTANIGFKLAPSELAMIKEKAAARGKSMSRYLVELAIADIVH